MNIFYIFLFGILNSNNLVVPIRVYPRCGIVERKNSAASCRAWISPSFRSSDIEYPGCGDAGLTEGCWSLRKTPKTNINFSIEKIYSSIFHFLPILKFHEIILIKTNDKELYTLDFTPINQNKIKTLFNLFIGNNVNANIRIRNINTAAPSRAWISPSLWSSDIEYPGCGAAGLTEGCWSLRKTPYGF